MTASPTKVNGTERPARVLGPTWQIAAHDGNATVWEKESVPESTMASAIVTAPTVDPVAEAEAEAIRAKAWADAEAARIEAEAKADAVRAKAEAEAERQRLANERQRMVLEEKQAAHEEKMAEAKARQEEIERQAAAARQSEEAQKKADAEAAKEMAAAEEKWRKYAIRFAVVCGIVALPVQIAAFWNPNAWWLVAAPVMLEGGSWVVQKGAAAAVANRRPLWHYRTIAWLLAFVAAGINLWHGLHAFDPATAGATAFASLAGPGVWDLHEHGRIRKRDGVLTWRQRRAEEAEQKRVAAKQAAEKKAADAAKAAAAQAAEEAAKKLAEDRAKEYQKVWEHALKLAAALGETTVTESVWKRAYNDIEGTDPGDSVDVIHGRNAAARRVAAARSQAPGNTPSKVTNAQRVPHLPSGSGRGSKTGPKVRGIRRQGDAPKFTQVAKKQAAITAKQATANPSKES